MPEKEPQEDIISSSASRLFKLGKMAGSIGASMLGNKAAGLFRSNEKKEKKKEENFLSNALKITEILGKMKGGAMKIGQMLSLQEGVLPKEVTQILSTLQQEADPVSFDVMQKVIDSNIADKDSVFKSIEPDAFAAASIGQVHKVTLHDGRQAALKVQYPEMEKVIRADLKNLRTIFGVLSNLLFKVNMSKVWAELETQLAKEVDYENEAAEYRSMAEILSYLDYVVIPKVIDEASGKQILCTEFTPGLSIDEACKHSEEERDRWGRNLFHLTISQLFLHGKLQSDPNIGNYAFLPGGKIIMYDFGNVKYVPKKLILGYRAMIKAFLEEKIALIPGILKDMGIHYHDGRPVERHIADAYVELFAAVFNSNDYRFEPDNSLVARLINLGRNYLFEGFGMVFPPDVIFIDRAVGGMFGNLTRLRTQAKWRDTLLEVVNASEKSLYSI